MSAGAKRHMAKASAQLTQPTPTYIRRVAPTSKVGTKQFAKGILAAPHAGEEATQYYMHEMLK